MPEYVFINTNRSALVMNSPFSEIADWFNSYCDSFAAMADSSHKTALMELKREHSLEVALHTAAIADDERWTPFEREAAELLGLIHDVGRFPQLAEYGTFSDDISLNHGELGFRVIGSTGSLESLPVETRTALSDGVRYHNQPAIPQNIGSKSAQYLKLIRDSDKLDIFRIIHEAVASNRIANHPEITLNIDLDGPINPAALAELKRRQNVTYANVRSLADFGLAQLAWLYDLNHRYSVRFVLDHGILDQILVLIPETPDIIAITDDIRDSLDRVIAAS
jgi:hypothetical protein